MKTEEELWAIVKSKLDQKYPPVPQGDDSDEADAIMDLRIKDGVKMLIEEKKKNGMPVARYDIATKKAYIQYADGRKEYIDILEGL